MRYFLVEDLQVECFLLLLDLQNNILLILLQNLHQLQNFLHHHRQLKCMKLIKLLLN